MISFTRYIISPFVFAMILLGQSLRVPPSQTDLKTPGIFWVILDSPPGKAPVVLQWEFSVPPVIEVTTADITIAKAAESARKSLTCAARSAKPAVQRSVRYACILGACPINATRTTRIPGFPVARNLGDPTLIDWAASPITPGPLGSTI